jgi:hypothetical protein
VEIAVGSVTMVRRLHGRKDMKKKNSGFLLPMFAVLGTPYGGTSFAGMTNRKGEICLQLL